jgi:phenylacetate-CoA ligase
MEYGSAETGALAYQDRSGVFQIFWRHYVVEWCASATPPGTGELLITSLYPRCFPLVRYEIGDLAETAGEPSPLLYRMRNVIGKRSDYIELSSGSHINPQVFIDAIDRFQSITDFQVVQSVSGKIELKFVATADIKPDDVSELGRRLTRANPGLRGISIERVLSVDQTPAGKSRRIRRETAAPELINR